MQSFNKMKLNIFLCILSMGDSEWMINKEQLLLEKMIKKGKQITTKYSTKSC